MFEKLFEQILRPRPINRDDRNSFGDMSYSLQGTHSYEEVQKLNRLTAHSAVYGYCYGKGPVALIGIPAENVNCKYFKEVPAYGEITSKQEFEFEKYPDELAKQIDNYIVYGSNSIQRIADLVKFEKIHEIYDSRFREVRYSHKYRTLKMKCKLEGKYSFDEVEFWAKYQNRWAVDRGIAYATLENNEHIAIMSFWYDKKNEVSGFRDVWEYGKPKPATQKITFMTDEEAAKIKDFSIYLYDYSFLYAPQDVAPNVVKLDGTFTPGFDFYSTKDGKDLRLAKV